VGGRGRVEEVGGDGGGGGGEGVGWGAGGGRGGFVMGWVGTLCEGGEHVRFLGVDGVGVVDGDEVMLGESCFCRDRFCMVRSMFVSCKFSR